jgi:tetratricopeptide (TPR) repeat protein
LPEALSAARRANGLVAGADVGEALRRQVRARLADLELLDRLENVRLEKTTEIKDYSFNYVGTDALYGQTFRDAGLDVEALPAEEAAERIEGTTVAVELAAVLDHWAWVRGRCKGLGDPGWKHFLRVARLADPDAWRERMREVLGRGDWKALGEMTASEEVFRLPPATLYVLGIVLRGDGLAVQQMEAFLREAQRHHPNDFWINHLLFEFCRLIQPPKWEEAIRFASVEVALRPENPAIRNDLGVALMEKGRQDESIAEFREAIRIKPAYAAAHTNLGNALKIKGQVEEAFRELREAVRVGNNSVAAHVNLGVAYGERGQMDEAVVEFRRAIQIDSKNATAHLNLGKALGAKGQVAEAIKEYNVAIKLKNDEPKAHYNLAVALRDNGQIEQAIAEYRAAIQIKEDDPEAYYSLGLLLGDQGRFSEALTALKRSHALGSRNSRWPYPTARLIQQCQRFVELEARFPAILSGERQPKDTDERMVLAQLCQRHKKLFAASARWYGEAFAREPKLAEDWDGQHRYEAACAAVLAGCGQGNDADKLDTKERARLRRQALDWLRADLKEYRQAMEKSAGKAGPAVAQRMQHWLQDADFAGVRGPASLAQLPEAERQEWQKLWQEVEALRQSATRQPTAASPAGP